MNTSTYTSCAALAHHLLTLSLTADGHRVRPISGPLGPGERRLLDGERIGEPLDATRPGRLFESEVYEADDFGRYTVRLEVALTLSSVDEYHARIDGDEDLAEHVVSVLAFCRQLWRSGVRAVTREAEPG